MFNIIAVTNRRLCRGDFLAQLERVVHSGVAAVILREKDLDREAYEALYDKVLPICAGAGVKLICHTYAYSLPVHLPFGVLEHQKMSFDRFGVSIHSLDQARQAQEKGACYLTAGHIFETACKAGLAARGIEFLRAVSQTVSIPVYAIGGIGADNIQAVKEAGASGACLMSSLMESDDPASLVQELLRLTR